jgi:hypothetical protein
MSAAKLFASTIIAAALFAAVLSAGGASAQSPAAPSGNPQSGSQADSQTEAQPPGESTSPGMTHPQAIDDQDLRRFAAATAKIRIIDREYTKKKDGKSDAERASLGKDEDKENLAAVEGAGLTVALYNAISKQIQDDPALAKKAYEYIYAAQVK